MRNSVIYYLGYSSVLVSHKQDHGKGNMHNGWAHYLGHFLNSAISLSLSLKNTYTCTETSHSFMISPFTPKLEWEKYGEHNLLCFFKHQFQTPVIILICCNPQLIKLNLPIKTRTFGCLPLEKNAESWRLIKYHGSTTAI